MFLDGELQNPPVPKEVMANLERMEVEVFAFFEKSIFFCFENSFCNPC